MSISEVKINEVGRRAQENANLIWNAANSLFGAFKPHEYGLVILPMCVIKRFHDCLIPTHEAVLAANKEYGDLGELKVGFLKEASSYLPKLLAVQAEESLKEKFYSKHITQITMLFKLQNHKIMKSFLKLKSKLDKNLTIHHLSKS